MKNTLWYTRDDGGDRAIWNRRPEKDDGEWNSEEGEKNLVVADFNGEDEEVDNFLGKGVHGLRRGGITEIVIHWHRIA